MSTALLGGRLPLASRPAARSQTRAVSAVAASHLASRSSTAVAACPNLAALPRSAAAVGAARARPVRATASAAAAVVSATAAAEPPKEAKSQLCAHPPAYRGRATGGAGKADGCAQDVSGHAHALVLLQRRLRNLQQAHVERLPLPLAALLGAGAWRRRRNAVAEREARPRRRAAAAARKKCARLSARAQLASGAVFMLFVWMLRIYPAPKVRASARASRTSSGRAGANARGGPSPCGTAGRCEALEQAAGLAHAPAAR